MSFKCAYCTGEFPFELNERRGGKDACRLCASRLASAAPHVELTHHAAMGLRGRITCPHCWHQFPVDQILWVSQHEDLIGDQVLGSSAAARFLPTRFTVDGRAIDARGLACQQMACPRCHLGITRALLESEPLFVSIIGGPASGKSYYLTALTWHLRRQLAQSFALSFTDADTMANLYLNQYEETLFLQSDAEQLVEIRKTEQQGELYDTVMFGQQHVLLPKPFLFNLRPASNHSRADKANEESRVVCLYDNAGEHFRPGEDTTMGAGTQHLAQAKVLLFLFDPTQDLRFREECKPHSNDPQLQRAGKMNRQETLLTEAVSRIRKLKGLPSNRKYDRPLIVIVPKLDVWEKLLPSPIDREPVREKAVDGSIAAVDLDMVESTSSAVRALLARLTPEFVAAAEDFFQSVIYIPVTALGTTPELLPGGQGLGVRPKNIKSRWVTVPFLYMFAKWSTGLVHGAHVRRSSAHKQNAE